MIFNHIENPYLTKYIIKNFKNKLLEINKIDDSNIKISGPSWEAKKYINKLMTQYRKQLVYLYKTKNKDDGWSIAGV